MSIKAERVLSEQLKKGQKVDNGKEVSNGGGMMTTSYVLSVVGILIALASLLTT